MGVSYRYRGHLRNGSTAGRTPELHSFPRLDRSPCAPRVLSDKSLWRLIHSG